MIRPVHFTFNAETAVNNAFQVAGNAIDAQQKAEQEFDQFVSLLKNNGVDVTVVNDTPEPHTPDSIFPNNWISFHEDGTVILYPMFAHNRRQERKPEVLEQIKTKFRISGTIDLSAFEKRNLFLEGTGSMVLDRDAKIAYACLSPRTNGEVLNEFCRKAGYSSCVFHAVDEQGMEIYHTNVMMCVADRYVVICMDSLPVAEERNEVENRIKSSGKEIISITLSQMNHFAGNMLQVNNMQGEKLLVMSTQAFESLDDIQKKKLNAYNQVVHASLQTIETNGGGSARCMMAEIHLPERN